MDAGAVMALIIGICIVLGCFLEGIGMNLFIIRAQTDDMSMRQVFSGIVPFLIAPIVLDGLMFAVPELALWLPSLLY